MDWKWTSFVFAMLAFGILYWLMNRYAFKPLFAVMEQRRQMVLDQMNAAENSRKEASAEMEAQKQALAQARQEANEIIEKARVTSTKQADNIVDTARSEATRLKDEAVRDIESEKNKAIASLRSEVGSISVAIASKIVEKQIDEKSQEQIVDNYLKEVSK
ncbi:F0F1 ATP synthase subunit B [Paenibacillus herberti]|uniref:ATP synthase subunit b n=1 Tax=Paenibacillus herberti TaxID=1619309 RepID=A0A229NWQ3_9BACL|nr:F0F1 ATP synthase subunit B [Paenibacillus herberti]OXM14175.1 ATP synthase F0 subunit B [Paenibacillus herberti]